MCNRYTLSVPAASLFPRYNATQPTTPVAAPAPELFPSKPAYVVRDADGVRIIDVMAWGFPMMTKGECGKDIHLPFSGAWRERTYRAAARPSKNS